jgi:lipopolysaccharide transport system permease protein
MAIVPIIWLIFPWHIGLNVLLCVPGLAIVYLFVVSLSVIISMICVRYRDVPPVVAALLQLLFFISPIIWLPSHIKGGEIIVELNPIAYLLSITRDPLMGNSTGVMSWFGALGAVALLTAAMIYIYTRYRSRVVYWA